MEKLADTGKIFIPWKFSTGLLVGNDYSIGSSLYIITLVRVSVCVCQRSDWPEPDRSAPRGERRKLPFLSTRRRPIVASVGICAFLVRVGAPSRQELEYALS